MIKLLIFGSGNVNPINILVKNIRDYGRTAYHIAGLNLIKGNDSLLTYKNFDQILEIDKEKVSFNSSEYLKAVRNILRSRSLLKGVIADLAKLQGTNIRKRLRREINRQVYLKQVLSVFAEHDIINLHWVSEENCEIIAAAPVDCKIIISFWGSDLMASAGVRNYRSVFKACQRSNAITVASVEMREILLSKFGRDLKSKVRITPFGQSDDCVLLLNARERLFNLGISLLNENGINWRDYKYVLKIGYSGFESQNHIQLIQELSTLPSEMKSGTLLIVPMTYGATSEYSNRVRVALEQSGLRFWMIGKYLLREEVLSVAVICNIMLNVRDNDGFNNSMIETLLAGNLLISGRWLPYSMLRQNNIYFHEIDDLSEVKGLLCSVDKEFINKADALKANPKKVMNLVSGQVTGSNWDLLYQTVSKIQ